MPKITIDDKTLEANAGETILEAARRVGIEIPALCYRRGGEPSTSCMVCVVKVGRMGKLVPSCATVVQEGMTVESATESVTDARRAAIELLLSDHVGDCIAPCQVACPAHMNIPLMIRQIAAGQWRQAVITVREHIPFPAVLGRICPAPCENACRRGDHDSALSICLLKKVVGDIDLSSDAPYLPPRADSSGKRVAIIGGGATGLSAAYYLQSMGHACTVFDAHSEPGGMILEAIDERILPPEIRRAEFGLVALLGAEVRTNTTVGEDIPLAEIREQFDAVVLALGGVTDDQLSRIGLAGLKIDRKTLQTDIDGVFAGGNMIRPRNRLAIRSVGDGRVIAHSVDQYLSGEPVVGASIGFNTRIGRLSKEEMRRMAEGTSSAERLDPETKDDAMSEARRCLHCDCRRANDCLLRRYADVLGANPNRFRGVRRLYERSEHPSGVVFEPGKCISCGLCVKLTADEREKYGFTFLGRGFDVRVGTPFHKTLAESLTRSAAKCVEVCPTGALSFKNTKR